MFILVKVLDLCIMLKANKCRLYPSDWQKELLDKHFGSVRFVFNLALETKTWAYSAHKTNLSRYDLQVQLKDLKKDCTWLGRWSFTRKVVVHLPLLPRQPSALK